MVEDVPSKQKEEGVPLLVVTAAGDTRDSRANNAAVTGATPITAIWEDPLRGFPRSFTRNWRDRLPEYLSACWMVFILLGVSFLIFYIAGLIVYRDQTLIAVKCNATKTDCNMYYHKIVYDHVHFSAYSEFLSIQALKYPHVRHNIYFLFDDTNRDPIKHTVLYGRPIPNKYSVINKREIKSFQKRFANTNITVMSLNEFFAKSPMKDTWKFIPPGYLAFYARLYSVWKNGGIGVDLMKYNIDYSRSDKKLEHRINEYVRKIKEVREKEKAQRKEQDGYVGSGRIFVSYTLIRMDDLDNETKSISSAEPGTNTTVVTTSKPRTKKTDLLNKTSDNNTFYYVVDSVLKEFNVTTNNTNDTNIKTIANPDSIEDSSNKTAENNTVENNGKVLAEVNVTANINETNPTPDPIEIYSNKTAENISFHESNIVVNGFNGNANEKTKTTKLLDCNNTSGELNKTLNQFNVSSNTNDTSIEMFPAFELLMRDPIEMMLMGMNDDQNTFNSFKDMFSQQFEISVSGDGEEGAYFGMQSPNNAVLPVLAIDRCGLFVAAVAPRHRLLEILMKHKCNWAPPGFVIQKVMDNTCSSKFYNRELCTNTFIL